MRRDCGASGADGPAGSIVEDDGSDSMYFIESGRIELLADGGALEVGQGSRELLQGSRASDEQERVIERLRAPAYFNLIPQLLKGRCGGAGSSSCAHSQPARLGLAHVATSARSPEARQVRGRV